MSVNKALLLGNLGKDPELRSTQSGSSVCSFSIATTERRKDQSGQWVDHTDWHNIVCFGKTAENCSKYIKKGSQVFIEGRIQTRKWQDKEGKDRWTTEILANSVQFIGKKGSQDDAGSQGDGQSYGSSFSGDEVQNGKNVLNSLKPADAFGGADEGGFEEDDIPF